MAEINNLVVAEKSDLVAIANAIRAKSGSTDSMSFPYDFVSGIGGISGEIKLQEKTVTENGEVVADNGYDGLSKVIVNVNEDLFDIANLLGDDVENTKSDIKEIISYLIDSANSTTGNKDINLTDGVNALISGYGQGGSKSSVNGSLYSYEDIITGRCLKLDEKIYAWGDSRELMNGDVLCLDDSIFSRDDVIEEYNKSITFLKNYKEITELEIF